MKVIETKSGDADGLLGRVGWFLLAVAALVGLPAVAGWRNQQWFFWMAAAIPLLTVVIFQALPQWRRYTREKRLRTWALSMGEIDRHYFRTTPYEGTQEDRKRFSRSDGVHETILRWLDEGTRPVVYITGSSGAGKSSILNSYVIPHLQESAKPPFVTISLTSQAEPLKHLQEQLLKPGTIWTSPPKSYHDRKSVV